MPPVLRTPERKPGAENAGQTYSRNRRKNPANGKKIIIAVPGIVFINSIVWNSGNVPHYARITHRLTYSDINHLDSLFVTGNKVIWMIAPSSLSKLIEEQQERCAQIWRYLAGSCYNMPHANKFTYSDAFFRLYELNFRSMRVINLENLHILTQNHTFTIPIDNGR
jgi:hypothetical protein